MINKIVLLNKTGNATVCSFSNCYNWVFHKEDDGSIRCMRCGTINVLQEGQTEGVFPRPGREYWDRINELPTYSFWVMEGGVRRIEDSTGKWFEADYVRALMDEAQNEINSLRARLAQLEQKGTQTDE